MWKYWTRILADHSKEGRELKYAVWDVSLTRITFERGERNKEWRNGLEKLSDKRKKEEGDIEDYAREEKLNNAQLIHPAAKRQASVAVQYSNENKWNTIICKHIDESYKLDVNERN